MQGGEALLGGRTRTMVRVLTLTLKLRLSRFPFQGSFQSLVESGLGFLVLLLGKIALLAIYLELEDFFLQGLEQ